MIATIVHPRIRIELWFVTRSRIRIYRVGPSQYQEIWCLGRKCDAARRVHQRRSMRYQVGPRLRSVLLVCTLSTPVFAEGAPSRPWSSERTNIEDEFFRHERDSIRRKNERFAAIGGGVSGLGILAAFIYVATPATTTSNGWRYPEFEAIGLGLAGILPGMALGSVTYLVLPEPKFKSDASTIGPALFWSGVGIGALGIGLSAYGVYTSNKPVIGSVAASLAGGASLGMGISLMLNGSSIGGLATRVYPWSSASGGGMGLSGSF